MICAPAEAGHVISTLLETAGVPCTCLIEAVIVALHPFAPWAFFSREVDGGSVTACAGAVTTRACLLTA